MMSFLDMPELEAPKPPLMPAMLRRALVSAGPPSPPDPAAAPAAAPAG